MFGQMYATNAGGQQRMGIEGWRFVMFTVGLYSICVGLMNLALVKDPEEGSKKLIKTNKVEDEGDEGNTIESFGDWRAASWQTIKYVFSVPTFVIIVLQGIVGTFPWNALVFMTHYLQLLGMSNAQASVIMSTFLGASALGGLLGGVVGDMAAKISPDHGRILTCQFSVGIKLPFVAMLFNLLPKNGETGTVTTYGVFVFIMGILATWAGPACNNPIFAEIVPVTHRNLVYAFDRSFEGAIAACGAPIVGWLAQVFGYSGEVRITEDPQLNMRNAIALGTAIQLCLIIPWAMSFLIYTGLHWTYKRDSKKARILEGYSKLADDTAELEHGGRKS